MFTFINGVSIGIVLGVAMWLIGQRLGKAIVGTPSASHNTGSHAICPECNNSVSIKELKALSQCPHCKVDYPFVVRGKQQAGA